LSSFVRRCDDEDVEHKKICLQMSKVIGGSEIQQPDGAHGSIHKNIKYRMQQQQQ